MGKPEFYLSIYYNYFYHLKLCLSDFMYTLMLLLYKNLYFMHFRCFCFMVIDLQWSLEGHFCNAYLFLLQLNIFSSY